jgi:hypothetical protein
MVPGTSEKIQHGMKKDARSGTQVALLLFFHVIFLTKGMDCK